MVIEVRHFDDGTNYYVRVGDDVYEMSYYADRPNGVCIYLGDYKEIDHPDYLPLDEIPLGIVRQIASMLCYGRQIRS